LDGVFLLIAKREAELKSHFPQRRSRGILVNLKLP
jgi:hypothetical protein